MMRSRPMLVLLLALAGCAREIPPDADPLPPAELVTADVWLSAGQAPVVPRWATGEIVLHATETYDATGGRPNPFDLEATAVVEGPDGTRRVPAFFDGDGEGGPVGGVWKVRVCPPVPGDYTWRIESEVPGLDEQAGSFRCDGELEGVYRRGPLGVDPAHPRVIVHADGTPVYLLGKFLDRDAPGRIMYSHTLLSELRTHEDREAMVTRHVGMGLNKMNVYVANEGDYRDVSVTPWRGTAEHSDRRRFDLARWRRYDHWVRRLRDEGLSANLWVFADDSGFGNLPDADRERLERYAMARLSGYVHTLFILCLEWHEGWDEGEVALHARVLHDANPWDRLISVHGVTGDFAFPDEEWADLMVIQSGNQATREEVYAMGLRNRALAEKPLLNEEFHWGTETPDGREKAWTAFVAGASGTGTGADLVHLAAFLDAIGCRMLTPVPEAVADGDAVVGRPEPGSVVADAVPPRLVGYLADGGAVTLRVDDASGPARWFDPRTGRFRDAALDPVEGGVRAVAPDTLDWVLVLDAPR